MSDSKVQTLKVITSTPIQKQTSQKDSILVLHGWGMNSKAWDPIKKQLENKFSVCWLDLPGHGINSDVQADTLDEIVTLVSNVIINPTHIMGWSLGGIITQALMAKFRQQNEEDPKLNPKQNPKLNFIKSITLVASTPRFSQSDDWPNAMSQDVLTKFAENTQKDLKGTIKRFIALQFMGVAPNESFDKKMQQQLTADIIDQIPDEDKDTIQSSKNSSIHSKALRTGLNILETADLRFNSSSKQMIPQHWILGAKDKLIPVEVANDLKFLYPDDQITLLENAGHAPFMTHPTEFLHALTHFITDSTQSK